MKEIWKDIEGFEGYYQVSTHGRVRGLDRSVESNRWHGTLIQYRKGKIIKPNSVRGYYMVSLSKEDQRIYRSVHRWVAKTFIPNPQNKTCVNHKDFNKINNHVSNLEWVTHKENTNHTKDAGRLNIRKGEAVYNSKLTEAKVRCIRKKQMSQKEYAEKYGVSFQMISKIQTGKAWKHVA